MTPQELDAFEPFLELDEKAKLVAATHVTAEQVEGDRVLFDIGDEDDEEFFLVAGEIELAANDGVRKKIRSGMPVARFPLALLRPRKFSARVVSSSASVIRINMNVLRRLKASVPVAGDSFSAYSDNLNLNFKSSDVDMDRVKEFLISARSAISENRLTIASFDSVSNAIFNVVNDPDVSLDVLTSAVQLDPAISAKMIMAANSAFFSGLTPVDSVRAALVRLGLDLAVQLITVMVMKEVFHTDKESLQLAMSNVWRSSLTLASYSVVIGKRSNANVQTGQTLLAGLMSEIGALVIITYLDEYPSHIAHLSSEILSSARIKRKLGKDLLIHWVFPEPIIDVIEHSEDYHRERPSVDLVDIVMIARLFVRLSAYRRLPVEDLTSTPAFTRLGFDVNDAHLIDDITEEAKRYAELFSGVID